GQAAVVEEIVERLHLRHALGEIFDFSRLTDLVLKANNLDPKDYEKATLKKIFTSDPEDKKSYLNTTADARFKDIVAAFN
ncbi:DUF1217 domain-containing protein, partial [Rhizobium ruizarguesonis]